MIEYAVRRADQRDAQSRKNIVIVRRDRRSRSSKFAAYPHPGKVDAGRHAVLIDEKPPVEKRPNEGEAVGHQNARPIKSETFLGEKRVFQPK